MEISLQPELPLKNATTFVREFPLMTAKLACYMYHRCSYKTQGIIETLIKYTQPEQLKHFQFISRTSFDKLKTNKIPEMFVYDFPIMSAEKAYTKYNQLPKTTQDSIKNLIENTKNRTFIEIFNFTTEVLPDVQNILSSYQLDDPQAQPKQLNNYHQVPLWKLYMQITRAIIEQKVPELFQKNDHLFTLDDLQSLQIFVKEFPKHSLCQKLENNKILHYDYKIRCNLQGFKTLLGTNFCEENNYFYLSLYIPIVGTLTSWLLCQCIKNYCYSDYMANLPNLLAKTNERKMTFNQTANEYNSWLANNQKYLDILQLPYIAEEKLEFELTIPRKEFFIIHSPLILQIILSLLNGLFSTYRIISQHNDNLLFKHLHHVLGAILCQTLATSLMFLTIDYESYLVNNSYLSITLANAIIIITALYGIYFYKAVSPYMNKKRQNKFTCTQKEINALLQRTDIEILN